MLSAIKNCWSIPELRKKIIFTIGIIIIARMASNLPCPGINPESLRAYFDGLKDTNEGNLIGMFSMFSGGALEQFSVAALGIMPYITASIIMQLLVPVLPQLEKLQREGEPGRQKIQQYTRYFTLAICIIQGIFASFVILDPSRIGLKSFEVGKHLVINLLNPGAAMTPTAEYFFIGFATIVLTAGTMAMVWLGERITEKGIGNGASLLITIGIVARMPQACFELYQKFVSGGTATNKFGVADLYILFVVFALVTAYAVMMTQGVRQIPIQMARKMMGTGRGATGTSTFLPLKVNYAGIMPIIFGSALLQIPPMLFGFLAKNYNSDTLNWLAQQFQQGNLVFTLTYIFLIIAFSYFWVANMFNPLKISDYLKRDGAYIPGIRPGQPTADFLDGTMTRLTFAGSLMLTILAVFPMILYDFFQIPHNIGSFFGGTSLLISVGVLLDTLNQMESHLVMKNYDGFLKSGRLRGRSGN